MFPIIMDSKTKWFDVSPVSSTPSSATLMILQCLLSRFGIPRNLFSDNVLRFCSAESGKVLSVKDIIHIKTAP